MIQQSIAVFRQSCYLQDYRNDGQELYVVSRMFCRTTDTLVKSSMSSVLLFVGVSRRPVYCQSYFLQDYQYIRQDQCTIDTVCVAIDTVCVTSCRTIDTMVIRQSQCHFSQYSRNDRLQSEFQQFFVHHSGPAFNVSHVHSNEWQSVDSLP